MSNISYKMHKEVLEIYNDLICSASLYIDKELNLQLFDYNN